MNKITDAILIVTAAVLWLVATIALVRSDENCSGVCDGCVYAGWCPKEGR